MTIQRRIRIKEFCKLIGRTRSTFDRWRNSGKIPKEDGRDPYPYWLEDNVAKFVEQKPNLE
ncbi:MAG: helix-turn-helix transcriptional regulator [Moraxella sp.]